MEAFSVYPVYMQIGSSACSNGYFLWRQKVTNSAKNDVEMDKSDRLHLALDYKTPLTEISYWKEQASKPLKLASET
jgi:hypothetical protein